MGTWGRKALLLVAVVVMLLLPMPASVLKWGGLPPGFGLFPPQFVQPAPGFSLLYFLIACAIALVLLVALLLPTVFGFKPARRPPPPPPPVVPMPWWFFAGMAVAAVGVGVMWFGPTAWAMWTFVPTWWGFIVGLDGLAWKCNGGHSLITAATKEFLASIVMSVLGWYVFEFLNYYSIENWYYPNAGLQSKWVSIVWYTLAYTTVWPAVGEWYTILTTVPWLKRRWENGPAITLARTGQAFVLLAGAVAMAVYGGFPYLLFFVLWIGPLVVLSPVLSLLGFWTPFRPITQGDWSPVFLGALSAVATAVFWESWNYGSEFFRAGVPANPNYWIYDIPYVNVVHVFSEMPLLGYFGYLPFGLLCWVWWLVCVHLFDLRPDLQVRPLETGPDA